VGVLVAFGGAVEILSPTASPPIASQTGLIAVQNSPGLLFPSPPGIIGVVAFNLVGGGG
jgi:hypothetical protein